MIRQWILRMIAWMFPATDVYSVEIVGASFGGRSEMATDWAAKEYEIASREAIRLYDKFAFWLAPDWTGDSRDNPRDPSFEPFWMRAPSLQEIHEKPIPVSSGPVKIDFGDRGERTPDNVAHHLKRYLGRKRIAIAVGQIIRCGEYRFRCGDDGELHLVLEYENSLNFGTDSCVRDFTTSGGRTTWRWSDGTMRANREVR